jgi:hypothetical protein
MTRAENQAKQLALDTVRQMTVHPPHEASGVPGMKVEKAGVMTRTLIEKTPYYNMHVGKTDSRGFQDATTTQIMNDMKAQSRA